MAFETLNNQDDQTNPQNGGGQTNIGGPQVGSPGANTPGRQQGQGSGRFTNIRKFINANQGNTLGQDIAGNIQNQAGNLQQQFGQQRENLNTGFAGEQQRLGQANQFAQQVKDNATQLTADPNTVNAFKQITSGQYKNPQIANANQLQQQAQTVQQQAQATGTEQGRFGLLQQQFARPTYSKGQQRLDQLLLQSAPGQLNTLQQNAKQAAQQTQQGITGLTKQEQDLQNQIKTQADAAKAQLTGALGQAGTGLESQLKQQQADFGAGRDLLYNALKGQGNFQEGDADKLQKFIQDQGLKDKLSQQYYGAMTPDTLQKFLGNAPTGDVSMTQVATPEEVAKYKALQTLSDNQGIPQLDLTSGAKLGANDLLNTTALENAGQERKKEFYDPAEKQYQDTMNTFTTHQKDIEDIQNALKGQNLNPQDWINHEGGSDMMNKLKQGDYLPRLQQLLYPKLSIDQQNKLNSGDWSIINKPFEERLSSLNKNYRDVQAPDFNKDPEVMAGRADPRQLKAQWQQQQDQKFYNDLANPEAVQSDITKGLENTRNYQTGAQQSTQEDWRKRVNNEFGGRQTLEDVIRRVLPSYQG